MNNAGIARFEPLRSLAFGSISGTYAAIGNPLGTACVLISIDNGTDASLTISFNGVDDHIIVFTASGKVFDIASDKVANSNYLALPANTTIYVKGSPSAGSVYVSVMYASTT